jgi:tellurite methyltransferase
MAEADRRRWNERYAAGSGEQAPLPRLEQLAGVIRPRTVTPVALDLACGTGRHTLYLARLGYVVDAWDISDVALQRLQEAAAASGLAARVRPRQIDLDAVQLPDASYDLVLDSYFLDRRLLPAMEAAVKPGGLLFMETLLSTPQKPGRPDFYLQPGELRAAFSLEELYYEENLEEGWATLLARKGSSGGDVPAWISPPPPRGNL